MAYNKLYNKISDFRNLKVSLPKNAFSYLLILFILISLPILLIALKQNADNRSRAFEQAQIPTLPIIKSPYSFYFLPNSGQITLGPDNTFKIDVYANSKNIAISRFHLLINYNANEVLCLGTTPPIAPDIIVSNCNYGGTNNYVTFESQKNTPFAKPISGKIGSITFRLQNNTTKANVQIYAAQDFPGGTYMTNVQEQFMALNLPSLPYCYSKNISGCLSPVPTPTLPPTPLPYPGKGLYITPGRNYVTIYDKKGAVKVNNDSTIELWIKPSDKGRALNAAVISKYLPNTNYRTFSLNLINMQHLDNSSLTLFANTGNSYLYSSTDNIIPNDGTTWTHLAITNKDNLLKIFVNGILMKSLPYTGKLNDSNYSKFYIGASAGADDIYSYYIGTIDDLRISNIERPIADNWKNGVYKTPLEVDQYTSALWRFEDDFLDESSHQLDGSPSGSLSFVEGKVASVAHSPRPSVFPTPTSPNQSYTVPVLSLRYFPLDPKDPSLIDRDITGTDVPEGATLEYERQHVQDTQSQLIQGLDKGSIFHGYKNPAASPALSYEIVKEKEFLKPVPVIPYQGLADHIKILQGEDFDICNLVDNLGVKEVWLWMYHSKFVGPIESYQMGPFGQFGNSIMYLPLCQNTYTVYDYNYGRGIGEALEDHAHHLENVFKYVDANTFAKFVGNSYSPFACGKVHCPPNVMYDCENNQYDWSDENIVQSSCQDWNKDGKSQIENVSCHNWSGDVCGNDSGDKFKVWWMQNIPSSWWNWIGNFDESSAYGNGLD